MYLHVCLAVMTLGVGMVLSACQLGWPEVQSPPAASMSLYGQLRMSMGSMVPSLATPSKRGAALFLAALGRYHDAEHNY